MKKMADSDWSCSSSGEDEHAEDESAECRWLISPSRFQSRCSSVKHAMKVAEKRVAGEQCASEGESYVGGSREKRGVLNARRNRMRRKFYVAALDEKLARTLALTAELEKQRAALQALDRELTEKVRHLRREVVRQVYSGLPNSHASKEFLNTVTVAQHDDPSGDSLQSQKKSRAAGDVTTTTPAAAAVRCSRCGDRLSVVFPGPVLHDHSYSLETGAEMPPPPPPPQCSSARSVSEVAEEQTVR